MDAIADVTQRIATIQSRLSSLRPPDVPFAELLSASSAATSPASAATTPAPAGPGATVDAATRAAASARPAWAKAAPASTTAATVGATDGGSASRGVTVPAELRAYGNGRIPAGELVSLGQGSHRLAGKAAAAWQRMEAAAAADGVTLKITDSYRSYDTQVDLVRRKGLYSEGGLAAKPGTSNHGWGLAVDLKLDGQQQAWMRANGPRFGFVEDTPREPWHWGFHG